MTLDLARQRERALKNGRTRRKTKGPNAPHARELARGNSGACSWRYSDLKEQREPTPRLRT